jgi:fatty-acid desaturase
MYMSFQGRLTQFFGAVKVCVDNAVALMVWSGLQGDPLEWVSSHRYHHQFCDTEMDPHTPYEGFWHSHMGWLLDEQPLHQRVRSHGMVFYFQGFALLFFSCFSDCHLICKQTSVVQVSQQRQHCGSRVVL